MNGALAIPLIARAGKQEHDVDVLVTSPTVPLEATLTDGTKLSINSPEVAPCCACDALLPIHITVHRLP